MDAGPGLAAAKMEERPAVRSTVVLHVIGAGRGLQRRHWERCWECPWDGIESGIGCGEFRAACLWHGCVSGIEPWGRFARSSILTGVIAGGRLQASQVLQAH